jgi:hypothetical protein
MQDVLSACRNRRHRRANDHGNPDTQPQCPPIAGSDCLHNFASIVIHYFLLGDRSTKERFASRLISKGIAPLKLDTQARV